MENEGVLELQGNPWVSESSPQLQTAQILNTFVNITGNFRDTMDLVANKDQKEPKEI